MNRLSANAEVGSKNIWFGVVLFAVIGVVVGIPLTIDFLGGSLLTGDQYLAWKVVHAYGVFLAFINFFLGLCIDPLSMPKRQKELVSWSFLLAGFIGGFGRPILLLLSAPQGYFLFVSLSETVLFVVGTLALVLGQMKGRAGIRPAA